jgi:YHS domain-containing protein
MRNLTLAAALALGACNPTKAAIAEPERQPEPPVAAPQPVAATPTPATPSSPSVDAASAGLTLVSAKSQVCMVNNQFMGREQIPVQVDGKTYFGCCEMCQGRLNSDPSARTAKDPVSGKVVDKASAVIAKRPSGDVVYFENTANFETYRQL